MNKKVKYTFKGASQDVSKSKHPFQYYFDAQHIRITSTDTQSTGAVANEKGTELVISLPSVTISGKVDIPVLAVADSITLTNLYSSQDIDVLMNDTYLDAVTITIVVPPSKGTAVILPNNRVRYTDTYGVDNSTDSFTYQIDDGKTQSSAEVSVTMKEQRVINPEDGSDGILETKDNFDGRFYYYQFSPCNKTLDLFIGKSLSKITDEKIYYFYSSQGEGLIGKAIKIVTPQATPWTSNGVPYLTVCPPQKDIPPIKF